MEKVNDKKHFQKYFSTKFLVEIQWNFFKTWNYLNYLSELLARHNIIRRLIDQMTNKQINEFLLKIDFI